MRDCSIHTLKPSQFRSSNKIQVLSTPTPKYDYFDSTSEIKIFFRFQPKNLVIFETGLKKKGHFRPRDKKQVEVYPAHFYSPASLVRAEHQKRCTSAQSTRVEECISPTTTRMKMKPISTTDKNPCLLRY